MEYLFLVSAAIAAVTAGWLRFARKRREFVDWPNPNAYSDEYISAMQTTFRKREAV